MATSRIDLDVWAGREMLFFQTVQVLHKFQEAPRQLLTPDDERRLREVSDIFHAAGQWIPACQGRGPLPDDAGQAYRLVLESAGMTLHVKAVDERLRWVKEAVCTINAIRLNQAVEPERIEKPAELCMEIGTYLLQLHEAQLARDADDE